MRLAAPRGGREERLFSPHSTRPVTTGRRGGGSGQSGGAQSEKGEHEVVSCGFSPVLDFAGPHHDLPHNSILGEGPLRGPEGLSMDANIHGC